MRSTRSLIHLARDVTTGKLINADRAIRKPGKGRYQCLDSNCKRYLTVARSKHGRLHFKHFRGDQAYDCKLHDHHRTSTQHAAAQTLLEALFSEAVNRRAPMPVFLFKTPEGIQRILPFILGERVVTEWTCPLKRRRADIAILDRLGDPLLLIEVFHTHAVDGNKRLDLSPYWWIQVSAREVMDTPFQLNILDHGNLPYEFEVLGHQSEMFERALLSGIMVDRPVE